MSPEERAKAIVERYDGISEERIDMPITLIRLIATAIREAEDAAYERAAVAVQNIIAMPAISFKVDGKPMTDHSGDEHFLGTKSVNQLIEHKAALVRSLKSQEP